MYKIGEFSKITNLTAKALHYYDEIGILTPSSILDNGYRLYDEDDYKTAMRIKLLKELGFSINEIKDVLSNIVSDDDLQDYLIEKKLKIERQIRNEKRILNMIDIYLKPSIHQGGKNMNYEMSIVEIEEQLVASISFQGTYQTCSDYFPKLFKIIKNKVNGYAFNMYYDGEYKEEATIESCVPIKERIISKDIEIKTLPKIKALKTTHVGNYSQLSLAYKALMDYAKLNNIELNVPTREVYIKGPGMFMKGNPDKYVTEIYIPINEKD